MKTILLLAFSFFLFVSCKTTEPSLSVPETTNVESYQVKGRQGILINQKLKFGDYETSKVKRSWTRGGEIGFGVPIGGGRNQNILGLESVNKEQNFSFQMKDSLGNNSEVYAISEFAATDIFLSKVPVGKMVEDLLGYTLNSRNLFYMQVLMEKEPGTWELILDNEASQQFAKKYRGVFARDLNNYYTLVPMTKIKGKKGPKELLMGSVGFEVLNKENEVVAAVSLIDGGNVYFISKDPQEKFLLANLTSALLLQQDLDE